MKHRGRGVKVVGLLIFLASETHGSSVGIGSFLRLDNIFFRSLINYFCNEIVIFCRVSYHSTCIIKFKTIKWYRLIYIGRATSFFISYKCHIFVLLY